MLEQSGRLTSGSPTQVRFGLKLPNCGGVLCPTSWATPEIMHGLAADAARLGFSSVWLHDHLLTPSELRHLDRPAFHEPLITAASLAAAHPTLRIGTATIVLPMRDPLLLAKQVTTLDAFNPGGFILGLGAGRYESEFIAAGLADNFAQRGRRSNEYLEILRALLYEDPVTYEGESRSLTDASMYPKPPPHRLPVWYAGNAPVAVRRAAKLADGWIGAAVEPAEMARSVQTIAELRVDLGEEASPFQIALSVTVQRGDGPANGSADLLSASHARLGGCRRCEGSADTGWSNSSRPA